MTAADAFRSEANFIDDVLEGSGFDSPAEIFYDALNAAEDREIQALADQMIATEEEATKDALRKARKFYAGTDPTNEQIDNKAQEFRNRILAEAFAELRKHAANHAANNRRTDTIAKF